MLSGLLACLLAFPLSGTVFAQNAPPPPSPPPQTEPEKAQAPPEPEGDLPPDETEAPAPSVIVGATLKGKVTGTDRKTPLEGARVHAIAKDGRVVTSSPTDAKGRYQLKGVPAGTYHVAVSTGEGVYTVESEVGIASASNFTVNLATIPAEAARGTIPGMDLSPRGYAAIVNGNDKKPFWGSAKGIILIGVTAAALALILSNSDGDEDPKSISPSSP
ncbi:MAG TPA: carboxypeptidase-like regulatory domain-containing protein [Candidatus Polarisedimenticolia bacterium]|nr:carboxypeptidase-like regulatory domain-containing protein [Candidatus Polarisedimenticolia bacterium]